MSSVPAGSSGFLFVSSNGFALPSCTLYVRVKKGTFIHTTQSRSPTTPPVSLLGTHSYLFTISLSVNLTRPLPMHCSPTDSSPKTPPLRY